MLVVDVDSSRLESSGTDWNGMESSRREAGPGSGGQAPQRPFEATGRWARLRGSLALTLGPQPQHASSSHPTYLLSFVLPGLR